eukprot:1161650-Pelagomonas_calceolata.AAC.5
MHNERVRNIKHGLLHHPLAAGPAARKALNQHLPGLDCTDACFFRHSRHCYSVTVLQALTRASSVTVVTALTLASSVIVVTVTVLQALPLASSVLAHARVRCYTYCH